MASDKRFDWVAALALISAAVVVASSVLVFGMTLFAVVEAI